MIVNMFFNERVRKSRGAYHPLKKRYPFSHNEKIVVKLAANIKGMTMAEYVRTIVVPKAAQDAKKINRIIDELI
jgi:hypothetical protein